MTTKIHALVDALGNPANLMLTAGQIHDLACARDLIENADLEALIADKAYDADPLIDSPPVTGTRTPISSRIVALAQLRIRLRGWAVRFSTMNC